MSMRTVEKTIRLHRTQREFRTSAALYRAFIGGRGSGKSWVACYDLIRRAKKGRTYLLASPTYPMLFDSEFRTFTKLARELGVLGSVKASAPASAHLTTGADVLFRSADDPDRLRGPNLSGAVLMEASLMKREVYDIVIAALREDGEAGWLSAAMTPRGPSHWTYEVFATGRPDTALFRSRTGDNPFNPVGFEDTLARQYGEAFARQELGGEFIEIGGGFFRGLEKVRVVDAAPTNDQFVRRIRAYDLASTEAQSGADPDYTAGVLMGKHRDGTFWVLDVIRERLGPAGVRALIKQTAHLDGVGVAIRLEREGGASGKIATDAIVREDLAGFAATSVKPTAGKAERAEPWAAQVEAGNVVVVKGRHTAAFLDEHRAFPAGAHDDMVDGASLSFSALCTAPVGIWMGGEKIQ